MKTPTLAKTRIILGIIVIAATVLAYLPCLQNDFTNWDDPSHLTENTAIRSFSLHNLGRIFTPDMGYFQPVPLLSFMAEYHFFGLNPRVYHFDNLALHCLNALLVFALVFALSRRTAVSLIVSLLFALHPLHVESVAWVAERKDLLAALFYFLSLNLYIRSRKNHSWLSYALAIAAFILSLLAKPMAVSLPLVLLLVDYIRGQEERDRTPETRGQKDSCQLPAASCQSGAGGKGEAGFPVNCSLLTVNCRYEKLPFFAIAAIFAVVAVVTQHQSNAIAGNPVLTIIDRICLPFYGVLFYALKTLIPAGLCAIYPIPEHLNLPLRIQLYAAPVIVAAAALLLARFGKNNRAVMSGSLFYVVTLLPVAQIVLIGDFLVAERYAYIPTIGLYFMLASGIVQVPNRKVRTAALCIVAVAGALLGFASFQRCQVWRNSISLWNDVVKKHPCAIALINRGTAFARLGEYDRAIDDYDRLLADHAGYARGYYSRGLALSEKGDFSRAIGDYSRAIQLDPGTAEFYNDRGTAFNAVGEETRAIEDFSRTLELNPAIAQAWFNRGAIYSAEKMYDRAVEDFSRALELDPGLADCWQSRGLVWCFLGQFGRAIEDFSHAISLNNRNARAYYNRGITYMQIGESRNASSDFEAACNLGLSDGCRALTAVNSEQ